MNESRPDAHGVYRDDLERIQFRSKQNILEIKIAHSSVDGMFRYGYDLETRGPAHNCGGVGVYPSATFSQSYRTRKECLIAAVNFARKWFAKARRYEGHGSDGARAEVEAWLKSIDPGQPQQKEMVFEEVKA